MVCLGDQGRHAAWGRKAAAPGETGGEVKQVGVKAGGRAGRAVGTDAAFMSER